MGRHPARATAPPAKKGSEWVFSFLTWLAPLHRKTHSDPFFVQRSSRGAAAAGAGSSTAERAAAATACFSASPSGRPSS